MDLQPIFSDPILEQTYLDPGYPDHASDVWLVKTASEEVVVRVSRLGSQPADAFWLGVHELFGVDAGNVLDLEAVNDLVCRISPIPAPRVRRKGVQDGRQYVVVEKMPGDVVRSFAGLPDGALERFGRRLAATHEHRFDYCGSATGTLEYPLDEFHARVARTMRAVAERHYRDDRAIAAALEPMCQAALLLPAPRAGALILVDIDPTQYLQDGRQITAVIDTEAYGIGPRELDFIALEYVLDRRCAAAIARGYRSLLPLPELSNVRPVYRFLYRLLGIQGDVPLEEWMAWEEVFGGDDAAGESGAAP